MTTYPASQKQTYWVAKLVDEKMITDELRGLIKEALDRGLNNVEARGFLDILFDRSLPSIPVVGTVTEPGFYRHDGSVFRVVLGRQSGNLYAKKVTAHGFDFEAGKGMMRLLKADQAMTPEEVRLYGVESGVCAQCATELEDPISVHLGLGPVCGPRVMGKEAFSALRKEAKLVPHVAEALKEIKDRKAAEKAVEAARVEQLTLV